MIRREDCDREKHIHFVSGRPELVERTRRRLPLEFGGVVLYGEVGGFADPLASWFGDG